MAGDHRPRLDDDCAVRPARGAAQHRAGGAADDCADRPAHHRSSDCSSGGAGDRAVVVRKR